MSASATTAGSIPGAAKDMKVAMTLLNAAGLSTSIQSYFPSEVTQWLDPKSAIEGQIRNKIPGIGGLRIPRF